MGTGSTSTELSIPGWLEDAAKRNLSRADTTAGLGYAPYYGPDIAALTPMQQAAMQSANSAASAFGMAAPTDAMAGMPAAQTYAGGVQGYSSAPMYEQALGALKSNAPGLYDAIAAMFINPQTGAAPTGSYASPAGGAATDVLGPSRHDAARTGQGRASEYRSGGGGGAPSNGSLFLGTRSLNTPLSYAPGGINTRNPGSLVNRVAAAATSGPQGAPTASSRPMARPY